MTLWAVLVEKVKKQALQEIPQVDMAIREIVVERYINDMTNVELLELVGRALSE